MALVDLHPRDAETLAAKAWDATHAPDDPDFSGCSIDHRTKLVTAAASIAATGTAGIAGLEAFEAAVLAELEVVPASEPAAEDAPVPSPGQTTGVGEPEPLDVEGGIN